MYAEDISLKRILVPLDGSEFSFQAASYAIKLAKMIKAEIICVHAVVNPPNIGYSSMGLLVTRYIEEAKNLTEGWYKRVKEMAQKEGVKVTSETLLEITSAVDSIVNYADTKKVDLIVMGTHGRTGMKRFLLGSVASGVVSHAKCSVLVVR
jgi:nucleotide-binding universal stress UspA family protein